MARTTVVLMRAIVPIALAFTLPVAAAAPRLTFRSVHYSSHPARPGEAIRITFDVRIDDGPMTPTVVVEEVPRRPGPPPPIIVLSKLESGDHTIDVFRYVVPDNPPERVCFRIALPGGALRDACLKRIRGSGGRWSMDVHTPGYWVEVPSAPTALPSPEGSGTPDLKLVGNISADNAVTLQNVGTGPANNVSVRKACLVQGRWVPVGGDREVRILAAGEETTLNLGKLGSTLGPCPSGSTQVRITADPGNRIPELDENNNTLEGGSLADLTVSDFKVYYPTTGPHAGAGHRIRFTVTNTGFDAGRFAWEVSVLRTGGKWESAIGQRISGVASGQSVEVDVPAAHAFASLGGVMARLTVDALNEIPETNENNNTSHKNVERPPLR